MTILAIDPGSSRSGWMLIAEGPRIRPLVFGLTANEQLRDWLRADRRHDEPSAPWLTFTSAPSIATEWLKPRGMPTSEHELETVFWIGRFVEAAGERFERVSRSHVKAWICNNQRAKDTNIRAAIIDRWGGKEDAIGLKRTPGPLYGITADVWSAFAIAITYAEDGADDRPGGYDDRRAEAAAKRTRRT